MPAASKRDERRRRILEEAWTGDAVLALFVREYILGRDGAIDQEKAVRMTSNRFLSQFGEASEVEARIGRVYAAEGIEGAFAWIRAEILPLFERQEAKRAPKTGRPKVELPLPEGSGSGSED